MEELEAYFGMINTAKDELVVSTWESPQTFVVLTSNKNFADISAKLMVAWAEKRNVTIHFSGPKNEITAVHPVE